MGLFYLGFATDDPIEFRLLPIVSKRRVLDCVLVCCFIGDVEVGPLDVFRDSWVRGRFLVREFVVPVGGDCFYPPESTTAASIALPDRDCLN